MLSTLPYERWMGKVLRVSPSSAYLLATALSARPASSSGARAASSSASTVGHDRQGTYSSPSQTGVLQAWLSENMPSLSS